MLERHNRLAVFDVDGTIFKSSCLEKVVDIAIQRGVMDGENFAEALRRRRLVETNQSEGLYISYISSLVGGFVASIADVLVDDMDAVVEEMVDRHSTRRNKFPRDIAALLRKSHALIAISGSPEFVVTPYLADMDFDGTYGSRFEKVNGRYTGQAESTHKKELLSRLTLDGAEVAFAIGNTIDDAGLLALARYPVALNPSVTLRGAAVNNGWTIVLENYDSVTQLHHNTNSSFPDDYDVIFDGDPELIFDEEYLIEVIHADS